MCPCSDDFHALPAVVVSYVGCLFSQGLTYCGCVGFCVECRSMLSCEGWCSAGLCKCVMFAHKVRLMMLPHLVAHGR